MPRGRSSILVSGQTRRPQTLDEIALPCPGDDFSGSGAPNRSFPQYCRKRPISQDYRTFLSTDTCGGLDGSGWTKAPPLLDSTVSRERITLAPPPCFRPFPGWARANAPSEAAFLAGAALAALSPIARNEHPLGALWRQRLALMNAGVLARQAGRTEDEAALRDAWYLRNGNDPGPGGRILSAWRALSARAAFRPEEWARSLSAAFE